MQPQAVSCESCAQATEMAPIPGSLLYNQQISMGGTDWELLEVLPPQLLRREYNLHLKAFQRSMETQIERNSCTHIPAFEPPNLVPAYGTLAFSGS